MPDTLTFDPRATTLPAAPSLESADRACQETRRLYARILGAWVGDLLELRRTRIADATWTDTPTMWAWDAA